MSASLRRTALATLAAALLPLASACTITPMPIAVPTPVPAGPPPINDDVHSSHRKDRIRVTSRDSGAQNRQKIRVCLENNASGKNKGMHWKFEKKPRYVAKKRGQVVCGEHPTGNRTVTWHFFRTVGLKKMKHVGSYDIDVSGREGQLITFAWNAD